jgi:hypothetical protein
MSSLSLHRPGLSRFARFVLGPKFLRLRDVCPLSLLGAAAE